MNVANHDLLLFSRRAAVVMGSVKMQPDAAPDYRLMTLEYWR